VRVQNRVFWRRSSRLSGSHMLSRQIQLESCSHRRQQQHAVAIGESLVNETFTFRSLPVRRLQMKHSKPSMR
jgi:monoamine oxidase